MTSTFIVPGTRVSGDTQRGIARVGAIAFDRANRRIGLSARHILECEGTPDVYDAESGLRIGTHLGAPQKLSDRCFFYDTIGLFSIDRHNVEVRMATPFASINGVADPDKLLGAKVFKLENSSVLPSARVVGLGGAIRFADPYTQHKAVLHDVVEVAFEAGGADPVAAGDAGSLIIDENGAAVGLMISGRRDRCYVAPLQPFLRERKLILADDRAFKGEGRNVELAAYFSELRLATHGTNLMRADLRSDPVLHADPGGDAVPRHLLESLRS
jgi:hypothetical protein